MKFKPKKNRSLSLRKGKVNQNINFMVGGKNPHCVRELVKSLGRWVDEFLKDINLVKETSRTLQEGLHKIDRCPLQGKFWFDVCCKYLFRCYNARDSYMKLRQVQ